LSSFPRGTFNQTNAAMSCGVTQEPKPIGSERTGTLPFPRKACIVFLKEGGEKTSAQGKILLDQTFVCARLLWRSFVQNNRVSVAFRGFHIFADENSDILRVIYDIIDLGER